VLPVHTILNYGCMSGSGAMQFLITGGGVVCGVGIVRVSVCHMPVYLASEFRVQSLFELTNSKPTKLAL